MAKKVPTAGIRLGKTMAGTAQPGAAKKTAYSGKIGGTGNEPTPKSYAKGGKR
jgi:hypothetical protein